MSEATATTHAAAAAAAAESLMEVGEATGYLVARIRHVMLQKQGIEGPEMDFPSYWNIRLLRDFNYAANVIVKALDNPGTYTFN